MAGWNAVWLGIETNFSGLRRDLENGRGRGRRGIITFIRRDGAEGWGGAERWRGGLGFVWLWAISTGLELLQLFEGAGIGAAEGSFVAEKQVEARAVGETLEHVGEAIIGIGFATDAGKLAVNVIEAALDFVAEEVGFDIGEAAQAPAGGDHGFDQFDFDGAGGGELIEIGIEEALEVVGRFVVEDDGDGGEGGVADGESMAEGVLG